MPPSRGQGVLLTAQGTCLPPMSSKTRPLLRSRREKPSHGNKNWTLASWSQSQGRCPTVKLVCVDGSPEALHLCLEAPRLTRTADVS